jgi:hypothetical protein
MTWNLPSKQYSRSLSPSEPPREHPVFPDWMHVFALVRRNSLKHYKPFYSLIQAARLIHTTMWAFIFGFFISLQAFADNCYYPDGKKASDAIPCGNDSPMCCPNDWQCLDNGLCSLSNQQSILFGRYSCTSNPWGDGCPRNCVRDVSKMGNEAVVQCLDGSWCCDTNHPEYSPGGKSCCDDDNKVTFDFGAGNVFAVIKDGSATATSGSSSTSVAPSSQSQPGAHSPSGSVVPTAIALPPPPPKSRSAAASLSTL